MGLVITYVIRANHMISLIISSTTDPSILHNYSPIWLYHFTSCFSTSYVPFGSTWVFGGVRVAHPFSFLCCVFVLFVFVLCPVYPMLPVSLDCPFLIAPSVFSNVYLQTSSIIPLLQVEFHCPCTRTFYNRD